MTAVDDGFVPMGDRARHARAAGRGRPAVAGGCRGPRSMPAFDDGFVPMRARAGYAGPGRPALIGGSVVAAFAAAMTMWGTLAPISGAAIASGNLQVEG